MPREVRISFGRRGGQKVYTERWRDIVVDLDPARELEGKEVLGGTENGSRGDKQPVGKEAIGGRWVYAADER